MNINHLQLQSETMVKKALLELHPEASPSHLYETAGNVASSARQASTFETSANAVDLWVQPLLRYYTVLHWMKTILYLHDLQFPPSTAVLQHGVSVRRSKRNSYRWPLEAVHVYKDGILQSFAGLVDPNLQLPARFIIGDCLGRLPVFSEALESTYPHFRHAYRVQPALNSVQGADYVSRKIASNADLTVDEWKTRYIGALTEPGPPPDADLSTDEEPPGLLQLPCAAHSHPWCVATETEVYILDHHWWPEWVSHFLILYTLSSLCRYNPAEWSDIMTWNNETDAYFVREYLRQYKPRHVIDCLFRAADTIERRP